jgi:hypothetical protein
VSIFALLTTKAAMTAIGVVTATGTAGVLVLAAADGGDRTPADKTTPDRVREAAGVVVSRVPPVELMMLWH